MTDIEYITIEITDSLNRMAVLQKEVLDTATKIELNIEMLEDSKPSDAKTWQMRILAIREEFEALVVLLVKEKKKMEGWFKIFPRIRMNDFQRRSIDDCWKELELVLESIRPLQEELCRQGLIAR